MANIGSKIPFQFDLLFWLWLLDRNRFVFSDRCSLLNSEFTLYIYLAQLTEEPNQIKGNSQYGRLNCDVIVFTQTGFHINCCTLFCTAAIQAWRSCVVCSLTSTERHNELAISWSASGTHNTLHIKLTHDRWQRNHYAYILTDIANF